MTVIEAIVEAQAVLRKLLKIPYYNTATYGLEYPKGTPISGIGTAINALEFGISKASTVSERTAALQEFINYVVNNNLVGYIPPNPSGGAWVINKLYGKYDAVNNPNGATTPRNFSIKGSGRIGDKGASLTDASPERTVIKFDGTLTGDLLDFSTESSPWGMRNIEIADLVLIGDTTGYVLNNSGSFKCAYHNLTIWNQSAVGNGWKLNNFDQCDVSNIFSLGQTTGISSGIAFDFRNQATVIDGSLSTFRKLLAQGHNIGFQCGHERDGGIDGNFQAFNTFQSISALDCNIAMILGDRWHGNTFINSQLRGELYGLRLGSRADNNHFINGTIQCNDATNAITGLYLGYGSNAANKQAKNNKFSGVTFQTERQAAPPVTWNNDATATLVQDNVFEDCTFESTGVNNATNGIAFTSSGNSQVLTGSVIRPKFVRINTNYSYQGNSINIINADVSRTMHRFVTTTGNTITTLGAIRPPTNAIISIDAHIIAKDTANPATFNHASYKVQALAYNDGTSAVLVGSPTINSIESNAAMDCTVDTSGTELRLRITGLAATNITWHAIINAIIV